VRRATHHERDDEDRDPSYLPTILCTLFFTILCTLFFAIFGLIHAIRHSKMARERG
jgi:hypothetical protein